MTAARQGEDGLLSFLLAEFEKEGFIGEGAHEVMAELVLSAGPLGRRKPRREHRKDIERALAAAKAVGSLDAGQSAVSCEGLILALEAQEGTDAMLARVAGLPAAVRGSPEQRRGVLAIRRAAEAGLAGIVGEAGVTLLLERERVRSLADELGLFVVGVQFGPQ